jgi:hypothetical protein
MLQEGKGNRVIQHRRCVMKREEGESATCSVTTSTFGFLL